MKKILLLISLLVSICGATKNVNRYSSIVTGEWIPVTGHVQGIAINNDTLYMSFTSNMMKYNFTTGDTILTILTGGHNGGICFVDDTLFVPTTTGYVMQYDRDLILVDSISVIAQRTQVYGVTYAKELDAFYMFGNMDVDSLVNQQIYEYDRNWNYVQTHDIATGYQFGGIQCMEYWDRKFWVGCYGPDATLIPYTIFETDTSFNILNEIVAATGFEGATGMSVTNEAPPDSNEFVMAFATRYWLKYSFTEGIWDPSDLGLLQSWFESDYAVGTTSSGKVTSWINRGTDQYNMKQATGTKQPDYTAVGMGGLPTITFDGTSDYLHAVKSDLDIYTYFVVSKLASVNARRTMLEEDSNYPFSLDHNPSSTIWAWSLSSAPAVTSITGSAADKPYIFAARFKSGGGTGTIDLWRWTGTQASVAATVSAGNGNLATTNGMVLGTYRTQDDRFFEGEISAVLIYEDTLNSSEIAQVNAYLSNKYAILTIDSTAYYVDGTDGIDTNNGLSTTYPWKTLSKVGSSTFNSGDFVYLKKGQSWDETLTVPSDGVTFTSYGTGAKPVVNAINVNSKSNITVGCILALNGIINHGPGYSYDCGYHNWFPRFKENESRFKR
jgi:hypothetical protein